MKSADLVKAMREGATLRIRWKPRTIQKPKRLNILTYPDGRSVKVQWSLVSAAVKVGSIRLISRTGNTYDCEVVDTPEKVIFEGIEKYINPSRGESHD